MSDLRRLALKQFLLTSSHIGVNAAHLLDTIRDTAEEIGALEAQMWVYEQLADANQWTISKEKPVSS